MRRNTLESKRWFPYVAWTLVIVFAGFVLNLTLHVRDELNHLNQPTDYSQSGLPDNLVNISNLPSANVLE